MEPTNDANLWLGWSYGQLGNYKAAATAFEIAARSRPQDAQAQYWLGDTLYRLKRYPEAVAALKTAVSMTNQPSAWLLLGYCQYHQRSYQSAAESFHQCASLEPTNFLAHLWGGHSLAHLDRVSDAAHAFGRAASLQPNHFDANFWQGLSLLRLQRFAASIPPLEQARALKPEHRPVQWLLFVAYVVTGQPSRISGLNLGLALPVSILLFVLYLPALGLVLRKSVRPQANPAPGLGFTVAWGALMILGQAVFILVPFLAFARPLSESIGVGVPLSAIPLIAAAILGFARQPWGRPFAWPPPVPRAKLVLASIISLGGILLFDEGYDWLVKRMIGHSIPDQMLALWLRSTGNATPWLIFFAVAFAAPVIEEILFRGLLFGALSKWLSAQWTIVIVAAVFSLVHLEPIYFAPLFVVGLVLGWLRDRSGGLALPILLHSLNNALALWMFVRQQS